MNDEVAEALSAKSGNPRWVYDTYRRFLQVCLLPSLLPSLRPASTSHRHRLLLLPDPNPPSLPPSLPSLDVF